MPKKNPSFPFGWELNPVGFSAQTPVHATFVDLGCTCNNYAQRFILPI